VYMRTGKPRERYRIQGMLDRYRKLARLRFSEYHLR